MEFLLLLTGCVIFPTLHCASVYGMSKLLPGKSKGAHYAIGTRLVSLLQAVCASSVGLSVVLSCKDIMKERFIRVDYYAWFGFPYFYYDIGAMFLVHYHDCPKQSLRSIVETFITKKWLVVFHHLFLPVIGFPIVVFYRRGVGDFFVGCIYIAEISTPFLSLHYIFKKLDMDNNIIFKLNGFCLAISFLIGRILVFPFMYYKYGQYVGIKIWQVPFKIPLLCNVSCLGLMTLQLIWFTMIVSRAFIILKQHILVVFTKRKV
ncbi:TLC domain-containing protein 3A-like [Xenia sp. Carnegie-2017]|uniref:TLC domain-containing protein 3A-like n=1 Tax=Xenia sp. Carnegie-2017 TaxID=2897299 RepID=UPI001F04FCA0|nr:TLC domain-containing protein 3A-like [Xenia sp. Carnegie-2017]